jgi:hypothetical protein
MQQRILLVLCLLAALSAAFGAGSVTAMAMDWGKPLAVVTVENQSNKTIASVEISVSTCGTRRTLSQKSADIQTHANQATAFRFSLPLCGEGGHRTRVQFSDGKTVESPDSYIMNGSRIVERVQPDSIRSEVSSIPY